MRRTFSIPAFQLAVAMLAASAQATSFTYVNARFGTTCTFPDDVFTDRQPEPENGDGQEWLSADGASLICSGILNIDNDTPKGFVTAEKADNGPAYKITYSKTGKDLATLSGIKDGKIFYERRLFGGDGVIRTVWIEYPPALKAKYDALVGPIAASLKAG